MGLLCSCPQSAALATIPILDCQESVGQVQKLLFQRVFSSAGVKNSFVLTGVGDAKLLASWTPLLTAADGTKVGVSPYIGGPNVEPGAAREFGGGNETLGGVPIIVGREPTPFTANIYTVSQQTIAALKSYMCENVGVYLVDEFNRIIGLVDDLASPTEFYPIPISALFISDKQLGGLENPDMNMISFRFFPNWSDKLYVLTPTDFDPLTDLAV